MRKSPHRACQIIPRIYIIRVNFEKQYSSTEGFICFGIYGVEISTQRATAGARYSQQQEGFMMINYFF